mmetsp:Transcript_1462/g.3072  ORF Transcript_1462/g.3072 Transcript_1462/m.3072 type:complete len:200 (-) Transcript_1462:23-622(-)
MSASDQAKIPHNPTFVRLGKKVWFTLEHSQRARGVDEVLDEGLSRAKAENDDIAQFGLAWMGVGDFDDRRTWNDNQWIAFLRTWQHKANYVFMGAATDEEKKLCNSYTMYFTFYAALPELPGGYCPDGFDMAMAKDKVESLLDEFEDCLGDPLLQCNQCKKCALGKKLMRCTRCQSAVYCCRECQKKDWKRHKKVCKQN